MNLEELRQRTSDRLDDRRGTYDPSYLNRAINEAYADVVNAADAADLSTPFDEETTVTVAGQVREYLVGSNARRLYEVVRLYNGREIPLHRENFVRRNDPSALSAHPDGVYGRIDVGKTGETGKLYVGTLVQNPIDQTLIVRWGVNVSKLNGDGDRPIHVAEQHHGVIAYRAALLITQDTKGDPTMLAGLYAEALQRMADALGPAIRGHRKRGWY